MSRKLQVLAFRSILQHSMTTCFGADHPPSSGSTSLSLIFIQKLTLSTRRPKPRWAKLAKLIDTSVSACVFLRNSAVALKKKHVVQAMCVFTKRKAQRCFEIPCSFTQESMGFITRISVSSGEMPNSPSSHVKVYH